MAWTGLMRASLVLASGLLTLGAALPSLASASVRTRLMPHAGQPAPVLSDEEFVGPFPSWRNLRTDYGARGDGITDDTAAFQAALNDMVDIRALDWCVLYVAAGTYRITGTLATHRSTHWDYLGPNIVGEDPATTVIVWDGPAGQNMLNLDFWMGKISRLTLDGRGTAGVGLFRLGMFATACEISDMVFTDMATGLQLGDIGFAGQAEHAVQRCTFRRCSSAGIVTVDFNSLNIWVFWCLFEDCRRGVWNVMGNFHVYGCVFLRSTQADIESANLCPFAFVNNVSVGSEVFFDFLGTQTWGSPVLVQGNRIYDVRRLIPEYGQFIDASPAMVTGNGGPWVMLDNLVRSAPGRHGPAVVLAAKDQVLVGSTTTVLDGEGVAPWSEPKRVRSIGARFTTRESVPDPDVALPPTPPKVSRKVFEVALNTGNDARAIQAAIDAAGRERYGSRPVVHIPKGYYGIAETIVVPARRDIQIVGDGLAAFGGGVSGTYLSWDGPGAGPVVRLEGPSRVVLRDLSIHGRGQGHADGILITDCDQPGGRVYAGQLFTGYHNTYDAPELGVLVDGVEATDVTLLHTSVGGATGSGVMVKGGPTLAAGGNTDAQVAVVTGTAAAPFNQLYSVADGGRLTAEEIWIESWFHVPQVFGVDSRGVMTLAGLFFNVDSALDTPSLDVDRFAGRLTLLVSMLSNYNHGVAPAPWVRLEGDGSSGSVLNLANIFWVDDRQPGGADVDTAYVWRDASSPQGEAATAYCNVNGDASLLPAGFGFLDHVLDGQSGPAPSDQRLREGLEQLRSRRLEPPVPRREGVTDVKLFRVWVTGGLGRTAALELRADRQRRAPLAPTELAATAPSPRAVDLTWTDRSGDESGFRVERKTGMAGAYSLVGTAGADRTSLRDGKVAPSTTYTYRMWATGAHGDSGYSNLATVTTPGPPERPWELAAHASSQTSIALAWIDNATNEAGFAVERRAEGEAFTQIGLAPADSTSYVDDDLPTNAVFGYRVRAVNPWGASPYTNEASARTAMPGDVVLVDSLVGKLHYVPGGTFVQGSPEDEPCRINYESQFTHTLTRSLAVMETEVSRQMWADLAALQPSLPADPSWVEFGGGMDYPAQALTWYEAVLFANLLSLQQGLTPCYFTDASRTVPIDASNYTGAAHHCDLDANGYRLPSEGEWEHFARAGTTSTFFVDEPAYGELNCSQWPTLGMFYALETVAWFAPYYVAAECTHPVGLKAANPWGLLDVLGNVAEWCWDDFQALYPAGRHVTDWIGSGGEGHRVARGGGCGGRAEELRSAYRNNRNVGDHRLYDKGFRLVRTVR